MGRLTLLFMCSLVIAFTSCNKEEIEEELTETCIEGWAEGENGTTIYYEKCPVRENNCQKTFKFAFEVNQQWTDGPASLTVRNLENGIIVEQVTRDVQLYSHREQIQMVHDRRRNFTHEVTLELPTNACSINGKGKSCTLEVDIPCDGFANFDFVVCSK